MATFFFLICLEICFENICQQIAFWACMPTCVVFLSIYRTQVPQMFICPYGPGSLWEEVGKLWKIGPGKGSDKEGKKNWQIIGKRARKTGAGADTMFQVVPMLAMVVLVFLLCYLFQFFEPCASCDFKFFRALWAKSQITPLRRVMFALKTISNMLNNIQINWILS